jgi:hypothetical protein
VRLAFCGKKVVEAKKRPSYKTFDYNSEKGIKAAERYQQWLYKHYRVVKVKNVGYKVALWGEKKVR